MHLTHGYQKLDISSRTDLADALGPGSSSGNPRTNIANGPATSMTRCS
jgi:hypothetical protein